MLFLFLSMLPLMLGTAAVFVYLLIYLRHKSILLKDYLLVLIFTLLSYASEPIGLIPDLELVSLIIYDIALTFLGIRIFILSMHIVKPSFIPRTPVIYILPLLVQGILFLLIADPHILIVIEDIFFFSFLIFSLFLVRKTELQPRRLARAGDTLYYFFIVALPFLIADSVYFFFLKADFSYVFMVFFLLFASGNLYLAFKSFLLPVVESKLHESAFDYFEFTSREREIINLIWKGSSNKEIAYELAISVKTVKNHVYNIFQKAGVQSRVELIQTFRKFE
jgi:DNA-binding CsgD family transcriptional regulator